MEFQSKKLIEQINKDAKTSGKRGLTPEAERKYESNKKKWTISGVIIGAVTGIPLGLLVELWRFLTGDEWDNFFIAIVICIVAVVLSTVAGYFYGAYLDGSS